MVSSLKMATTVGFGLMLFKSASALFRKMYSVIKCPSLLKCHYYAFSLFLVFSYSNDSSGFLATLVALHLTPVSKSVSE